MCCWTQILTDIGQNSTGDANSRTQFKKQKSPPSNRLRVWLAKPAKRRQPTAKASKEIYERKKTKLSRLNFLDY
jgi:hypothetical protein